MAKLSDLIRKIDQEARNGEREKALHMIDRLLEKVPGHESLMARRERYGLELEYDRRIAALEERYGVAAGE